MRLFMLTLLAVGHVTALAEVGIEPVVTTAPDGSEQVWFRINTGSGYLFDQPLWPAQPQTSRSDTGVLWVDRNHRFGIVQSAAISADGHHIFANWYLNAERASYYRTLGTQVPVWEAPGSYTWAYGGQQIGVSRDASTMTLSTPTAAMKWSSNSPYPDWAFGYPGLGTGYAKCSRNGNRVVTCQNGVLTGIRSSNGHVQWTATVPEPTRLQGIDLSDNGRIVAVTVYDSCIVYDEGVRRAAIPIGTSNTGTQYAAAISGDGSLLVTGDYYGYVKLYRWDSTAQNYVMRWQAMVGTQWVAGVAISRYGNTIACGTGYANGKLCVFDSSSATPVMVYQNYGSNGAYVASVALSDSGHRVAAASWGDIATSGSFRVFTVHDVGDTTPLVAITRDDEPGSLFACDISGDGQFAVAGGKAVHAQVMGNGGEVYAVMMGSSEDRNVGVSSITSPGRYLQVGQPTDVTWRVTNYGDSTETFYSHCLLLNSADSLLRHDSALVSGLAPNGSLDVGAPQFTPDVYDLYRFVCYTSLDSDQYHSDDTMIGISKCFHDGMPVWIAPPNLEQTVNMEFTPRVGILNNGSYADGMNVGLRLADSVGNVIYSQTIATGPIPPDDTVTSSFPSLAISAPGQYTATAIVSCADDFHPENDTFRIQFRVTYEIMYDDGRPEAFYWVGRRDNDKFYVRFSPTLPPPYSIRRGRIYVNVANAPFDYVMLCPGEVGKPDTLNPLQVVYNVSTPVAPAWIEFDLDITRRDSAEVWAVLHWPSNSPALGVGADATPPIDLRSYFSSNQDTFRLWTTHDWMVRLTQSPDVGVAEQEGTSLLRFVLHPPQPNPFRSVTRLSFQLPHAGRVALSVFDATGRLVAVPVNGELAAGNHEVSWVPHGEDGSLLPHGIYFAKLVMPDAAHAAVRKLVLSH
ncbi:MAG: hypothetical protein ABIK86_00870 [candidate division WOR-3 bacterium]